jgi:hypothetical protein
MTPAPDYREIAARVNRRLAEQAKPGTMPEVVSACRVAHSLSGQWGPGPHRDLIREVAAEAEKENAK